MEVSALVIFHQEHVPRSWPGNGMRSTVGGGERRVTLRDPGYIHGLCIRIHRHSVTAVDGDERHGAGTQPKERACRTVFCDEYGLIAPCHRLRFTARRAERRCADKPARHISVTHPIKGDVVSSIISGATRLDQPEQIAAARVLGEENVAAADGGERLPTKACSGRKRSGHVAIAVPVDPNGGSCVRRAATETHGLYPMRSGSSLCPHCDQKEDCQCPFQTILKNPLRNGLHDRALQERGKGIPNSAKKLAGSVGRCAVGGRPLGT